MPLRIEHRERPQFPFLDVRLGEDEPKRHELHASGQKVGNRARLPLVADHFHRDPGVVLQDLGGKMNDGAACRARV